MFRAIPAMAPANVGPCRGVPATIIKQRARFVPGSQASSIDGTLEDRPKSPLRGSATGEEGNISQRCWILRTTGWLTRADGASSKLGTPYRAVQSVAMRPWPRGSQVELVSVIHTNVLLVPEPTMMGVAGYEQALEADRQDAPVRVQRAERLLNRHCPTARHFALKRSRSSGVCPASRAG